jgi:subtilisin family serine protease
MRLKALPGAVAAACIATASVAALAAPGTPVGAGPARAAPLYGAESSQALPGRYLVVYRNAASTAAAGRTERVARAVGAQIQFRYDHALRGFAGTLSDEALAAVRSDPAVAYVEADATVWAMPDQSNPPSWGLDRVDQRNRPLNNNYHYDATGAGVRAYIIDTGIRFTHNAFDGRATSGFDAIDGGSADDCNGHGTHVAGTVGGDAYGIAKSVSLVAVRVLNCAGSGSVSQVVAGIDWATGNHGAGQPAVANMSLGGGPSTAIDNAVRNSIADGITYAIAAGNSNANACNFSPARVAEGITVGSTTSTDARSSFSNFGSCLDLFAPGSSITSSWHTSDSATNTISGTSMATPHVAGAAALYLQGQPGASPTTVRNAIVNAATTGVVSNPGSGSPNRLLYTLFGGNPPPPPPPPPSGCGSLEEVHTGSLSGSGDADIQPNGTYYQAPAGAHRGCLDGPAGVDFDLYLQRWNGLFWSTVAQGITPNPDEDVTYNGSAGFYRWRVVSYSGSGGYTFGLNRP